MTVQSLSPMMSLTQASDSTLFTCLTCPTYSLENPVSTSKPSNKLKFEHNFFPLAQGPSSTPGHQMTAIILVSDVMSFPNTIILKMTLSPARFGANNSLC